MNLPVHIHNALTKAGGKRLNGEPNYKFMWSGDFTCLISNGRSYEPFRVVAEDCWLLVKYELPEFWGTKQEWELNNWEMGTVVDGVGLAHIEPLYTAGPYPSQGRYRNIMRIKRPVKMTDGTTYLEHCAPTLQWIDEFFPGVRDFLDLSVEQKAELIEKREADHKAALSKGFAESRKLYKGAGTAKQIQQKEEAIGRFLNDPERVRKVLQETKRRPN